MIGGLATLDKEVLIEVNRALMSHEFRLTKEFEAMKDTERKEEFRQRVRRTDQALSQVQKRIREL